MQTPVEEMAKPEGFVTRRAAVWLAGVLVAASGCNLPFERSGIVSTYDPPGPNPTGVSGIEAQAPVINEDNVVDALRIAGRVQVRLAGERGPRTLEYTRPRIQTGPHGVVLLGPNSVARLTFSDDSAVVASETGTIRLGDPAKGEPRVICERLTSLDLTTSLKPTLGPVELPGGALLSAPPGSHVRVSLFRDRFYRVQNEGKAPITVAIAGREYTVRPSEHVHVPVILNAPGPASLTLAAERRR